MPKYRPDTRRKNGSAGDIGFAALLTQAAISWISGKRFKAVLAVKSWTSLDFIFGSGQFGTIHDL